MSELQRLTNMFQEELQEVIDQDLLATFAMELKYMRAFNTHFDSGGDCNEVVTIWIETVTQF